MLDPCDVCPYYETAACKTMLCTSNFVDALADGLEAFCKENELIEGGSKDEIGRV